MKRKKSILFHQQHEFPVDNPKKIPQNGDGFLNFTQIRREHSGWYKCTSRHLNVQYSSIGYYLNIRCKLIYSYFITFIHHIVHCTMYNPYFPIYLNIKHIKEMRTKPLYKFRLVFPFNLSLFSK